MSEDMEWLVVLFLAFGVQAGEWPTQEFLEILKPVIAKCEADTGVDKGLVDDFSNGTMVDDQKLKCYMKCIFLEFQVLDETTGVFRYEKMLGKLPQEMKSIAYEMGRNCVHFKGEGGADLCQVSFDLHRCWQQADPEIYGQEEFSSRVAAGGKRPRAAEYDAGGKKFSDKFRDA